MNFINPKKMLDSITAKTDKDGDGINDKYEQPVTGAEYSTDIALPKTFWNRPLGRTLRGKNRAGKIVYAVAGTAVSIFTGINIDPLTEALTDTQTPTIMDFFADLNLWSLLFLGIALFFAYLKSRTGNLLDSVYEQARIGFTMWSDFKKKDSDGGREVTDAEKDQLIDQLGKIIEAIINVIRPQRFGRSND